MLSASPALRARRAPSSRRSARPRAALLGPCFKTGRALARAARASRRLFRAFSLRSRASFLLSLAVLLLYRPIRVFCLRWIAPPFTVPPRAQLLFPLLLRVRGLHPLWRLFLRPPRLLPAHPRRFAAGAFPFARRYSGNPCSFLLLRVLICLSSAGLPTRVVPSGAARPSLRALSPSRALPRPDGPGVPRRRPLFFFPCRICDPPKLTIYSIRTVHTRRPPWILPQVLLRKPCYDFYPI